MLLILESLRCPCRNWRIVVTGHSLGAGAAALVALYIRSFYPKSRAWAFEPPGGLVDGQLARASSDCITSVVLGKDWVPRLSISSFERLRDEMVRAFTIGCCYCKQAKVSWLVSCQFTHQMASAWSQARTQEPRLAIPYLDRPHNVKECLMRPSSAHTEAPPAHVSSWLRRRSLDCMTTVNVE